MFRQDIKDIKDYRLNNSTQYTWGDLACALSCVFDLVEQLKSIYYSPRVAMIYSSDMRKHDALNDKFLVTWDKCFYELGLITSTRRESSNYICKPGEYEILHLQKPGHDHFVRGNGYGQYSWDSLGIRKAQTEYTIKSKRIVTVKGER